MCQEKKQESICHEGFCLIVKPADKGITINIQADDAEKAEKLKAMIKCCGEAASKDCCK
jgi:hypothetical protein